MIWEIIFVIILIILFPWIVFKPIEWWEKRKMNDLKELLFILGVTVIYVLGFGAIMLICKVVFGA